MQSTTDGAQRQPHHDAARQELCKALQQTIHFNLAQGGEELLKAAPLPAGLAGCERYIEQLPAELVVLMIRMCAEWRYTARQTRKALRAAVSFQNQTSHRCACCLSWVDSGPLPVMSGNRHGATFFVICGRCESAIASGRLSESMHRNLVAYGLGGVR